MLENRLSAARGRNLFPPSILSVHICSSSMFMYLYVMGLKRGHTDFGHFLLPMWKGGGEREIRSRVSEPILNKTLKFPPVFYLSPSITTLHLSHPPSSAIYTQTGPRVSCSVCTWRSSTSGTCSGSARAYRSWTGRTLDRSTWARSHPCPRRSCCRGGPVSPVSLWSRYGGSSQGWGRCIPGPPGLGCWSACRPAPACPGGNKVERKI